MIKLSLVSWYSFLLLWICCFSHPATSLQQWARDRALSSSNNVNWSVHKYSFISRKCLHKLYWSRLIVFNEFKKGRILINILATRVHLEPSHRLGLKETVSKTSGTNFMGLGWTQAPPPLTLIKLGRSRAPPPPKNLLCPKHLKGHLDSVNNIFYSYHSLSKLLQTSFID